MNVKIFRQFAITALKYLPLCMSVILIVQMFLNFSFSIIGGESLLGGVILFAFSFGLGFCKFHQFIIGYNFILSVLLECMRYDVVCLSLYLKIIIGIPGVFLLLKMFMLENSKRKELNK